MSGRALRRGPSPWAALALGAALACALVLPAGLAARGAEAAAAGQAPDVVGTASEADPAADPGALTDQLDAFVDAARGGWKTLSVAVSRGGEPVVLRSYRAGSDGSAQPGALSPEPVDWGRTSDLLVWAAVMQLVQDGSLSLESRVYLRLPEAVSLPDGYESLTMLDLMNHASGINASPHSITASRGSAGASVTDALRAYTLSAAYDPGDVVAYSPVDAMLAAAVVEQVSGQPIADYLRDNVLGPLGATSTSVTVGEPSDVPRGAGGDLQGAPTSILNTPAVTCVGPASDLALVARGLMGLAPEGQEVLSGRSVATLFGVTRTFPGLGTPRVAHGMLVLPLDDAAFGMQGGTTTGFSCAAYMDLSAGVAVVVAADQAWRDDLTCGVARLVFGHDEVDAVAASTAAQGGTAAAPEPSSDGTSWPGVYQAASLPEHGPAKLLAALDRVVVDAAGEGDEPGLYAWGTPLEEVGRGLYRLADAGDQDAYRFHVSSAGGVGYARVESDSFAVPLPQLLIEGGLAAGMLVSTVTCLAYSLSSATSAVRARLLRRSWGGQGACTLLAALTLAACSWNLLVLAYPDTDVALSLFPVARAANLAYVAAGCLLLAWLGVTRWRGTQRAPRRLAACLGVMACALVAIMNFVYWEMLP